MVEIQSKEVIDKISEDLKTQPAFNIPRELAKQIQLVYDINPSRTLKCVNAVVADNTAGTIHTADSKKRTFVVAVNMSVNKSALNDSTFSAVDLIDITGARRQILNMAYEPTTAASHLFAETSLNFPIEVEKGSTIRIINGTGTASIDARASIFFYEVDPQ